MTDAARYILAVEKSIFFKIVICIKYVARVISTISR